ncbi:speckle targeted PIP5K1A-regulated poly(A) polymerase-like [Glandiceps talaboti]
MAMEGPEEYTRKGYGYMCNTCNVFLNTEKVLQDHLKGKKHTKLVSLIKYRKEQEEKSIFVRGFDKGTSELQLIDYFSTYGPVSNVIFDKDKGRYAIIELESHDVVEKILDHEGHELNGKKIVVKPREKREFNPTSKSKKSKAAILKESMKKNKLNEEELRGFLCKDTSSISDQMTTLMKSIQLTPEDIRLRYLICDLLKEIFQEFFPGCLVFPYGSSVNGFGSQGCDLDLQLEFSGKDCQYKFAKIPEKFKNKEASTSKESNTMEEASVSGEASGIQEDAEEDDNFDVDSAEPAEIMDLVAKIIKKCAPGCKHVKAIKTARCPVVKFTHTESAISCDISINNRLAMENTELLDFYGETDNQVRPFVYTIRQWAKLKGLAGNPNAAGPKLSNYALTLMALYFLQQKDTKIIPTVEELCIKCDDSEKVIINEWDCSFTRNADKVAFEKSGKNIEELLHQFFKFYSSFDFASFAVCPRTGCPLSVNEVNNQLFPSNMNFKVTSLCVQDPFELNHNVAMNVNAVTLKTFMQEIEHALQLFQQGKLEFSRAATEEGSAQKSMGLVRLFSSQEKIVKKLSESGSSIGDREYVMKIAYDESKLPEGLVERCEKPDEMKSVWFKEILEFYKKLLTDVFLFECRTESCDAEFLAGHGDTGMNMDDSGISKQGCTEMKDDKESSGKEDGKNIDVCADEMVEEDRGREKEESLPEKRRRIDSGISDSNVTETECTDKPVAIICKTEHQLWLGRRKVRKQVQMAHPDSCGLDLEKEISLAVKKKELEDAKKPVLLDFTARFEFGKVTASDSLKVKFEPNRGENEFQNFFHFFVLYFPKMLDSYLFKEVEGE